ncbi:MAG TPA: SpvB/TcaC N-terminal domain-containing protein, partial [Terrimicrobiaceae bacterium]
MATRRDNPAEEKRLPGDGGAPGGLPIVSLPKGGGAIRGIGEKFAANPVTGTGSTTVPIATSPGRSGFDPKLSLSYDSGAGNGPFGMGWNLSVPHIAIKTDKRLPKYSTTQAPEETFDADTYILSGSEDLVPVLRSDGKRFADEASVPGYVIHRYRPRIEGLFARVERWTNKADGIVHWRSITKDNVLNIYGGEANSRISDPGDPTRIFSWLSCETRDDKGNAILYRYKAENGSKVDLTRASERNRGSHDDSRRTTNRYLKRIYYGNRAPLLDSAGRRFRFLDPAKINEQIANGEWMFEVVFDYGEHDPDAPKPNDAGIWDYRLDPFSSYRAGFEVRTTRLCQRVLMFHHFEGEESVGRDCLVRSTDLTYGYEEDPANARNPVYTFLRSVTPCGYRRDNGAYLKRSLPPVEFAYTQPVVQDTVEEVDSEFLANLPIGLDGKAYQLTDLHGEGIPGILTEEASGWFYKRNLSALPVKIDDGREKAKAQFAPVEAVAFKPNLSIAAGAQFMNLAGDGQPDVVMLNGPMPGLYEHDDAEGWQEFRPFSSRLNHDMRDPNLRFVDLDGDGHADILITKNDAFIWHQSLAEDGFGAGCRLAQFLDEEEGPRLLFADGTQSIYLADMSGDGLTDLVRITYGEVCYWPNLGYGRFGAKVTMDMPDGLANCFDYPEQFDHSRVRLADIDGSGTTDIIYLHPEAVRIYFNQSGNSWSAPQVLNLLPGVDDLASIATADLLGNGTACLVWSSPLPGDARRPMRYVNLIGEQKPHLLMSIKNNLGVETRVEYSPSTKFYLQDRLKERPWITRLPFPVHVVERVDTYDRVSRSRFVTRYAYHHGYFDGEEREFRGFGMVEQWDTDEIGSIDEDAQPSVATNLNSASFVPPVHTKTWFHTGAILEGERISRLHEAEYYRDAALSDSDFQAQLLPDTILPPECTLEEEREACRALKGAVLRREVYSHDSFEGASVEILERAKVPYSVTEQNFTIERLQARGANRHAVFFTHAREVIIYHYDRNPKDPRISHALTLEVDAFGNLLRSVAVGYPRQDVPERLAQQNETHITLRLNRFTNRDDDVEWYRTGLLVEALTYEIVKPPSGAKRIEWQAMHDLLRALVPAGRGEPALPYTIPYEQWNWREIWNAQTEPGGLISGQPVYTRLRLIERVRTLFRNDDLTAFSPFGEVQSLALPGETYKLAFTPGLLAMVYRRKQDGLEENLLPSASQVLGGTGPDGAGYVDLDGNGHWWIPSGRIFYSPTLTDQPAQELAFARRHFFLQHRFRNPFGQMTLVSYDSDDANLQKNYDLLVTKTEDAAHNIVTALNDYRVLQPRMLIDPNGNRTEARFDALGMVVGTAVMGKAAGSIEGDVFDDFID